MNTHVTYNSYGSCQDDGKMQPQFLQHVTIESLEVKVKPSQRKHQTFSWSHIGNRLLARLAPLCSFPVWDLEVFGELPISSCEMLIVAPLFTPICCFQLIKNVLSLLVDFSAPKPYTFCRRYANVYIQSSRATCSKDPNLCSSH